MSEVRDHRAPLAGWPVPRRRGALARTRGALHDTLTAWGWRAERVDVVVLVACELLTNAHRHTRTDAYLTVAATDAGIRLDVEDFDPAPPERRDTGPEVEGGFGLHILDTLARIWGVERHARGKHVWAEINR